MYPDREAVRIENIRPAWAGYCLTFPLLRQTAHPAGTSGGKPIPITPSSEMKLLQVAENGKKRDEVFWLEIFTRHAACALHPVKRQDPSRGG
jgi:hypothetical protein